MNIQETPAQPDSDRLPPDGAAGIAERPATQRRRASRWWRELFAWAALALATLVTLWPLGLTNRVLAGVDAFTYFTPYWAYRMAELRAGHLPFWNPYLFLGVPFLANPQAAVLYPLHWLLSWLQPEQALIWSALLHIWLAGGLTYTFGRRSLRLSRPAAWLAGLIFGLGGFTLARVENINQLNALAWLPALLWLYDETARAAGWRPRIRWGAALAIVSALQLLAGHTQTAFVNMVGLGLWAGWSVMVTVWTRRRGRWGDGETGRRGDGETGGRGAREWLTGWLHGYPLPLLAIIPALLICAAQLLPTLELNGLGLRTGGLTYRQAVSFSLRPRLLAQSLLPPHGGGLAQAFGSEGYAEFVSYVGLAGLALALVGAAKVWRGRTVRENGTVHDHRHTAQDRHPEATRTTDHAPYTTHHSGLLLLGAAGFLLALGAYNPFYYLLWRFIPGFDLFRAPARWLELFALGAAALAGLGLDALIPPSQTLKVSQTFRVSRQRVSARVSAQRAKRIGIGVALLALAALVAIQQRPSWPTLAGWAIAGLATAGLFCLARHAPRGARAGLIALTCAELWFGARGLPFTEATAPAATSLRNAPAALLAAMQGQPPAGRDRFLSMSDIRYDPGDLAELRALQADRLPAAAVERLVRAAKQVEVSTPNLSLLYRLPAVDGYDGGLLPLGRYVELQGLFLPPELVMPDGRLREQLQHVPEGRLLDLTGVRFIVTDKQRDLWVDDIYYDLELPARLDPGQTLTLDLSSYPPFSATALGVVAEAANGVQDGAQLAVLVVEGAHDSPVALELRAGSATREPPAPVRLRSPAPVTPARITVRVAPDAGGMTLRGLSLIDERTGAHSSITVSQQGDFRRIYSGDVKIYERLVAPGRAWLVHGVQPSPDDATTLARLGDPAFDPRTTVVLAGETRPSGISDVDAGPAAPEETVSVVGYEAERVSLRAAVARPAVLVLADTFYPGWQATVDGLPAPILRANLMFRGVALAPGHHTVVFTYRPTGWRWGVWISLATLVLLCIAVGATKPGVLDARRDSGV